MGNRDTWWESTLFDQVGEAIAPSVDGAALWLDMLV